MTFSSSKHFHVIKNDHEATYETHNKNSTAVKAFNLLAEIRIFVKKDGLTDLFKKEKKTLLILLLKLNIHMIL